MERFWTFWYTFFLRISYFVFEYFLIWNGFDLGSHERFATPHNIEVDEESNVVFVSDRENKRISVFDVNGCFIEYVSNIFFFLFMILWVWCLDENVFFWFFLVYFLQKFNFYAFFQISSDFDHAIYCSSYVTPSRSLYFTSFSEDNTYVMDYDACRYFWDHQKRGKRIN